KHSFLSFLRNADEILGRHADAVVAIFTAVVAVSTILLWNSTRTLWRVTDSTLSRAVDTSKKELRAYISVKPLGIHRFKGAPQVLGHFEVENVGRIPAKNVSVFATIEWGEEKERTTFTPKTLKPSTTVLQPRAKMQFGSDRLDIKEIGVQGALFVW